MHAGIPPMPTVVWDNSLTTRQQCWEEIADYFAHITDGIGNLIDDGIFELVVALNILGFDTRQSCAGHTLEERESYTAPWVDFEIVLMPELQLLSKELRELYNKMEELEAIMSEQDVEEELYSLYDRTDNIQAQISVPVLNVHQRMLFILQEFYSDRKMDYITQIVIIGRGRGFRMECHGSDILPILPPEQQAAAVAAYQQEFADFCTFLKNKYFSIE